MAHPQTSSHDLTVNFDTRPQAVENWLRALPRGSIGRTSELIFQALQNLEEQELRVIDRFRVLEELRESVYYVTSNLNRHIQGQAYPLPEKSMRIASACQAIHDYMRNGYMAIFHELQKQNSLIVDNHMLITSIHRAIVYIEQSLLVTYESYSAFHHHYWEKLHELYQYAELHKLANSLVHEPLMCTTRKSNITGEYLRTLLLYLAEPYHLRPGEINQVHKQLEYWSSLCDLQNFDPATAPDHPRLPVIELDSDQPPKQSIKDVINNHPEFYRVLDTTRLVKTLKQERKALSKNLSASNPNKNTPGISLLRRLIESWEHSRQRRYPRQSLKTRVNVTIGLHHSHMQLMYEQHLKQVQQGKDDYSGFYQQPHFESIEIRSIEKERSDVWSAVYAWANDEGASSETDMGEARSDQKPGSIADYRVRQDNWTLINESAEGLGLICPGTPTSRFQVGEVISIQRQNSRERAIGLVRWMKARETNGVELGVMLLAPTATPIGLISEDPARGDYVIDRGLLLPLMPILNRPESLLTFSGQYRAGDIVAINKAGRKNTWIKLVKLIADNGSISQYLFTHIKHIPDNRSVQQDKSKPGPDQYSDIWPRL